MSKRAQAEAVRWLRFAYEDLEQAQRILRQPEFIARHAAWLAEQAAEKALKAVLILHDISFPRTHDLDLLSTLLPAGSHVARTTADLSKLSEYAVEIRYPGDWPEIGKSEVIEAVEYAAALVDAARCDLP